MQQRGSARARAHLVSLGAIAQDESRGIEDRRAALIELLELLSPTRRRRAVPMKKRKALAKREPVEDLLDPVLKVPSPEPRVVLAVPPTVRRPGALSSATVAPPPESPFDAMLREARERVRPGAVSPARP